MWLTLLSLALAGPHGPAADDLRAPADTGLQPSPCEDRWPFELVQLPRGTELMRLFDPRRSWGSPTMVDTIETAAGRVAARHPEADPLFIGDLSTHRGGALPPHRWHHDGRSADIGLFRQGGEQPRHGFERVWPSQLDVARTWTLVEALLDTGNVEHILLDQGHIDRLEAYVVAEGLMTEAEREAVFVPRHTRDLWKRRGILKHAPRHGDHLHLRVVCGSP
jgi:hypothetical protein